MSKLALAISIVAKAFENKTDKSGKPYILHCLRVMNKVNQNDEDLMIGAVMHDLIEDTDESSEINYTVSKIAELGFSDRVIAMLTLLTHDKEKVSYDEYIKGISSNRDATEIKKADLEDNSKYHKVEGVAEKRHRQN